MEDAIEAMWRAFGPDRESPARIQLGSSLFMAGRAGVNTGVKVVSTLPGNPAGIVAVFDEDGTPRGILDGPTVTAIRTGAGCGLMTDLLARADASTMAMLGAGAMAADQVAAIRAVRDIRQVIVWSRTGERARAFADRIGGVHVADPDEAVATADIVTTATPSHEPLFSAGSVRPGTHVNAIGAFTADMVELPRDLVRRAYVVVDDLEAARLEAGDLIKARRQPDAAAADVLTGTRPPDASSITIFKSVGIASQDVAAGLAAITAAERLGIGVELGGVEVR